MERPEMRVGLPAEQHLEQMPGIVREPVDFGIAALQPAREKVDRQGEAVHLGEERDEEGAEGTERAPVALGLRLEEAEGEEDEDRRVDDCQEPKAVGRCRLGHCRAPSSESLPPPPWPPCPPCMKRCKPTQSARSATRIPFPVKM